MLLVLFLYYRNIKIMHMYVHTVHMYVHTVHMYVCTIDITTHTYIQYTYIGTWFIYKNLHNYFLSDCK